MCKTEQKHRGRFKKKKYIFNCIFFIMVIIYSIYFVDTCPVNNGFWSHVILWAFWIFTFSPTVIGQEMYNVLQILICRWADERFGVYLHVSRINTFIGDFALFCTHSETLWNTHLNSMARGDPEPIIAYDFCVGY